MAEIRHITSAERPSRGGDCVLIERAGSGKFVASCVASHRASDVFYAQEPVDDVGAAIAAANTWADQNGVPVIYVVDSLAAGRDDGGAP